MNEYATAADFNRWEEIARGMTCAQLHYAIRDCNKAEVAMRGHNPIREGFYADQAGTYAMKLTRRRRNIAA